LGYCSYTCRCHAEEGWKIVPREMLLKIIHCCTDGFDFSDSKSSVILDSYVASRKFKDGVELSDVGELFWFAKDFPVDSHKFKFLMNFASYEMRSAVEKVEELVSRNCAEPRTNMDDDTAHYDKEEERFNK